MNFKQVQWGGRAETRWQKVKNKKKEMEIAHMDQSSEKLNEAGSEVTE